MKKIKENNEQKVEKSLFKKLREFKDTMIDSIFPLKEKSDEKYLNTPSRKSSISKSSTNSEIKMVIHKKKVWNIKVSYTKPLKGSTYISIHKNRKLGDALDQIMEDIESKIKSNQIESLMNIEYVYLTQNKGEITLDNLDLKIEEVFAQNPTLEVNFEESETLSELVS